MVIVKFNGGKIYEVSSKFKELDSWHIKPHSGVDLIMNSGTKILSPTDGVIEKVVNYGNENIGKGIILKTENEIGRAHV